MFVIVSVLLSHLSSFFRPKHQLALEVLALRHQLIVLNRQTRRPRLGRWDRCLWVMLKRAWPGWENTVDDFPAGNRHRLATSRNPRRLLHDLLRCGHRGPFSSKAIYGQ